jgi:nicotinamide mononucleotide transporter
LLNHKLKLSLTVVAMLIVAYFISSTPIEIIASLSGLLCVYLVVRENIWNFPIGFVNNGALIYVFHDAKLYADMTIQIFFVMLSALGWYLWRTNLNGNKVRPTRKMRRNEWVIIPWALVGITLGWGYVLGSYTEASFPYVDASIATISIIAQYFLASKVLETWYLWIIVDVLSIGLYLYKDLNLFAMLYAVFLVLAICGLVVWRREYKPELV